MQSNMRRIGQRQDSINNDDDWRNKESDDVEMGFYELSESMTVGQSCL